VRLQGPSQPERGSLAHPDLTGEARYTNRTVEERLKKT
jgi:hypothetical protein